MASQDDEVISVDGKGCYAIYILYRGLCSESARNMTRPDEQPIATVAADIRNEEGLDGRYSGGNHNSFDPLKVIQEESSLKPNP